MTSLSASSSAPLMPAGVLTPRKVVTPHKRDFDFGLNARGIFGVWFAKRKRHFSVKFGHVSVSCGRGSSGSMATSG